jgi:hypothetical protein
MTTDYTTTKMKNRNKNMDMTEAATHNKMPRQFGRTDGQRQKKSNKKQPCQTIQDHSTINHFCGVRHSCP